MRFDTGARARTALLSLLLRLRNASAAKKSIAAKRLCRKQLETAQNVLPSMLVLKAFA